MIAGEGGDDGASLCSRQRPAPLMVCRASSIGGALIVWPSKIGSVSASTHFGVLGAWSSGCSEVCRRGLEDSCRRLGGQDVSMPRDERREVRVPRGLSYLVRALPVYNAARVPFDEQ